ncbi:MAG: hypothetical protein N2Z65_02115 [Clostridiales bacterium]|nr:hypothetical protein [Clostridiales bacterium]
MNFNMFCEFTIGFAFGSFIYVYFFIILKAFPEMVRMLKDLTIPESWK